MPSSEPFYIQLKSHRESQKITLEEISKKSKINIFFLNSIENGDFDMLPKAYIRLFLKSYSIEIGADFQKVIDDYEIFSFGSIKKKSQQNLVKNISNKNIKKNNSTNLIYDRKKIISIISSLIAIYIFFSFVSKLNSTIQTNNLELEKTTNSIINDSLKNNLDIKISKNLIIPKFTESLFINSNLIETDNIMLPIKSPFIFSAEAINNTRIHYRIKFKNESIIDQDIILTKDSTIVIEYKETIYFDILNCSDVKLSINNIRIDNRINCNNTLLRASIDSTGAINASFYKK